MFLLPFHGFLYLLFALLNSDLFVLFDHTIFYYYPFDVHLFSNKRHKGGVDPYGRVGTRKSRGKRKHNQYILYVKNPTSIKKNTVCVREIILLFFFFAFELR